MNYIWFMALNQMNEEFNDAFETYFPRLGERLSQISSPGQPPNDIICLNLEKK